MKRFLVAAVMLSTVAFVGCQKKIISEGPYERPENSDALIFLGVKGPTTKTANEGVRDSLFLAGDQIGVTAALVDGVAADWTMEPFFDNAPAAFSHEGTVNVGYDDKRSYFAWGPAGEGGLKWNKYYPAKNAEIMIYAYYPYTQSADYVAPDGIATKPLLNVTLNTDTVNLTAKTGANVKQADVLWFATAAPVKRSVDTLKTMNFKHALAQLGFRFKRYQGSSPAFIDTIEFNTADKGLMDITTGLFDCSAANVVGAKYVIIPDAGHRKVPVVPENEDDQDQDKFLNIFGGENVSPLMILPLETDIAKQGTLRVVINISEDGTQDAPNFKKSMSIDLLGLTKGFAAGQKNMFNILVTNAGINLEAKIDPWDPNGNNSNLETE